MVCLANGCDLTEAQVPGRTDRNHPPGVHYTHVKITRYLQLTEKNGTLKHNFNKQ
jgi:hypothetical protein